jgi:hypothetical protein
MDNDNRHRRAERSKVSWGLVADVIRLDKID